MTPTELYKLQIENTELEAKLSNLRLKNEIALLENSGGVVLSGDNASDEVVGTIESEEAQGFRILTDGLTERQMDNLVRIAQFMRETGLDNAVIYA